MLLAWLASCLKPLLPCQHEQAASLIRPVPWDRPLLVPYRKTAEEKFEPRAWRQTPLAYG